MESTRYYLNNMAVTIIFYCKQCRERVEISGFKDIGEFFSNYKCVCGYQPNPKEYYTLSFKDKDKIKYILTYRKEKQIQQNTNPSF